MIRREKIRHTGNDPLGGPPIGARAAAAFGALLALSGSLLTLTGLRIVSTGDTPLEPGREGMVTAAGLSFFAIGAYLVAHAVVRSRRARRRRVLASRYPFEAWLWDHGWSRHGATDTSVGEALAAAGRAGFLLLFLVIFHGLLVEEGSLGLSRSFPFVGRMAADGSPGAGFYLVAVPLLAFDAVLAWALWDAGARAARLARHGRGTIRFEAFPFLTGEELRVALRVPAARRGPRSASVALRFIDEEIVTREQGGRRESRLVPYQLYADERRIEEPPDLARLAAGLTLAFPLPADLPTTSLSSDLRAYWQLDVVVRGAGPDYRGRFLLPVYATSFEGVEADAAARPRPDGRQASL